MAILGASEYHDLRSALYRSGFGKEELKALPNLPSEPQLLAAFQAIETFWENNRATLKANIDSALGIPTTNALARKIGRAWLDYKFRIGG